MKSDSEVQNCEYIKNEAGVVQLFTVSLIPYNDRNGHLQLIFNLALVPVPARDYTGKEQVILILCLMAHVLSCVCVIYVVGRAVYDPKFTAGSPKIKRFWPLLLALLLVIGLRHVLWWNFEEFALNWRHNETLISCSNFITLLRTYSSKDEATGCWFVEKPWRLVSGVHHLERIEYTLEPGISSSAV